MTAWKVGKPMKRARKLKSINEEKFGTNRFSQRLEEKSQIKKRKNKKRAEKYLTGADRRVL